MAGYVRNCSSKRLVALAIAGLTAACLLVLSRLPEVTRPGISCKIQWKSECPFSTGASRESWYAITLNNKKIGYATERFLRDQTLVLEYMSALDIRQTDREYKSVIEKRFVVDPVTFAVISFDIKYGDGHLMTCYYGVVDHESINVVMTSPTTRKEYSFKSRNFWPEPLAREILLHQAQGSQTVFDFTDFDSQSGCAVQKRLLREGNVVQEGDPAWAPFHLVLSDNTGADDCEFCFAKGDCRPVEVRYLNRPVRFALTSRAEATKTIASPLDITKQGEIATEKTIPSPRDATSLVVQMHIPNWERLPFRFDGSKASVSGDGDTRIVIIGVDGKQTPPVASESVATEQYLLPTAYVESDDPMVIETAKKIVGDATSDGEVCRLIAQWCRTAVRAAPGATEGLASAKITLQTGGGDCTEIAFLLAALAHSRGLATRLCVGVVYSGYVFRYHAWNKACINGEWVSVDAGFGQVGVDATHIQLWEGGYSPQDIASMVSLVEQLHGRLQIEVQSHSHGDKK